MDKLLALWENKNKDKHGNQCHNQRKMFSSFFISVDGMLGKEALVIVANLSQLMADKMDESISHMCD